MTANLALGDYVDVPAYQPSWRGQAGTTLEKWSFLATPTNYSVADGGYYGPEVTIADVRTNPNGTPSAYIVAQDYGVGWVYGDVTSSAQFSTDNFGWWDLGFNAGGSITLTIPLAGGPANTAHIWLQVTEAINPAIYKPATIAVVGGTQVGSTQTTNIETYDGAIPDNVTVYQTVWQVPAAGSSATITITGAAGARADTIIGGIVVDTSGDAPVANNVTYTRSQGLSWKIKAADLLTNASPTDAGDTLSLVSVAGGSYGTVALIDSGTWVGYLPNQPDQNLTDSFTYTVQDNNNGMQTSATVTLDVTAPPAGQAISITNAPGQVIVTFAGIPGYTYNVQRSTDVNFSNPTVVLTTNAPPSGVFIYTDTNPPQPQAYYRLESN